MHKVSQDINQFIQERTIQQNCYAHRRPNVTLDEKAKRTYFTQCYYNYRIATEKFLLQAPNWTATTATEFLNQFSLRVQTKKIKA